MLLLRLAYSINADETAVLLWLAVRHYNGRRVQLAVASTYFQFSIRLRYMLMN